MSETTTHITIKVLTRLNYESEKWHKQRQLAWLDFFPKDEYFKHQQLEEIDNKLFNISWINR